MSGSIYIVITPVRNEQERFDKTITSMIRQTTPPYRWVIVNDGSRDDTGKLADHAATKYPWIIVKHRADRGFHQQGTGVIEAFYEGHSVIEREPWDYLVKLDGDLEFEPDYFEKCLARFAADPKLGVGGGRIYFRENGSIVDDSPGDPAFHVRGATKIYRRATWDAIGGLLRAPGWDTLDEVKANMLGWRTYSFHDLKVLQLKATGFADGQWRNWFKNGLANYIVGYHPLFMLSKCTRRFFQRPVGVAAVGLLCGFVSGYLRGVPRVPEPKIIRYVRQQQLNRLLFRESLWRS